MANAHYTSRLFTSYRDAFRQLFFDSPTRQVIFSIVDDLAYLNHRADLMKTMTDNFQIPDALLARCVGRVDLVQRVLTSYIQQMEADLPELSKAAEQCDGESTRKLAHRIKGASANVQADDVRSTAEEIESFASQDRLREATAEIDNLRNHWQNYVALTSTFVSEYSNSDS